MIDNFVKTMQAYYQTNIVEYLKSLYNYPIKLIALIIDISLVIFLAYKIIKIAKNSRAWQILKGIALLIIITWLSGIFRLTLLNFILTSIMNFGVIALIVMFQPEIRRGLEQLGTNKISRFFGIDKDIATRTKEDIYKIVIAAVELSKEKTGALIVIERDIQIRDIIATGVSIDAEISPQLLTNIFVPRTPLHDGAVVIANNKIAAAACMLPLTTDSTVAKELGTRHRAAIGISQESDAIAVVVSEETGKISVAKDGTLIADVREDVLKKILIQNIVSKRFNENNKNAKQRLNRIKERIKTNKKKQK